MTTKLPPLEPILPPMSFSPARAGGTTETERAAAAERLRDWIATVSAPGRKRRCHVFTLLHVTGTGEGTSRDAQTSDDLELEDEARRIDDAARVAASMVRAAWTVTETYGGTQLFYVAAYRDAKPSTAATDQFPLRLCGPRDPNAGLNDAPAANAESTLALGLRYAEASHRMALDSLHKNMATMHDLVLTLAEQNASLQDNHSKLRAVTEEALDRTVTRQLAAYTGRLDADRKERMYLALERAIPKLAERFGMGPMGSLLRSLDQEQKAALVAWATTLKGEQRAAALEALDGALDLRLLERAQTQTSDAPPVEAEKKEAT